MQTVRLFAMLPLLASGVLTAQTSVSLVAATPIAAMTSVGGGAVTFQGVPSGRVIGSTPNNVYLTTNQSASGGYLSASTICYPTVGYQGGAGFNFFERAYARGGAADMSGSSASASAAGAAVGAHAVMATFHAAPGTVGRLIVSYRANVAAGGTVGASVDVGNDGTVEIAQANPGEFSLPYTFGASGQVDVRVGNECHQVGNGTSTMLYSWTEVYVGFQPDLTATCSFTNFGQGCGGVAAAGTELVVGNTRTILMLATGCFPNSPAIVASGSQQVGLQLPGGCSLLCNAEGIALVPADAAGNATATWSIPTTVVGTTYVQFLPIADVNGSLVIRTSNGVRVDCVH